MQTSHLEPIYRQALNTSRGVVIFLRPGHNIFVATHAQMYRYLPITKKSAVDLQMFGAGALFVIRNQPVRNFDLLDPFYCRYILFLTCKFVCIFQSLKL